MAVAKRPVGKNTDNPVMTDAPPDELPASVKAFGEKLLAERKAKRLTQVELSQRSGVSQSHISQLEAGNLEPRLTTILALSAGLDIESAALMPSPPRKVYRAASMETIMFKLQAALDLEDYLYFERNFRIESIRDDRARIITSFDYMNPSEKQKVCLDTLSEIFHSVVPPVRKTIFAFDEHLEGAKGVPEPFYAHRYDEDDAE